MAKIFIQEATFLDCAVLLPEQGPVGRSFAVDIYWEGELDERGMLFDFAFAKRSAKSTIDNEFDHKMLVAPWQIAEQSHSITVVTNAADCSNADEVPSTSLTDPRGLFILKTYPAAIKKISSQTMRSLGRGEVSCLEKDIASAILRQSPENVRCVDVVLRDGGPKVTSEKQGVPYFYTHSLCSHVGNCQRFHGHKGAVEVYHHGQFDAQTSQQIAAFLNGKYIISQTYLAHQGRILEELRHFMTEAHAVSGKEHGLYGISYTGSQGPVCLIIPHDRVLVLEQESTVENICSFLAKKFDLKTESSIRVFEGLCKGACYP